MKKMFIPLKRGKDTGKKNLIDNDITEISQRILLELETASSKDLSEAKYARQILQLSDLDYTKNLFHEIESVPSGPERFIEKRAVIQALLLSTWLQRPYFIIRSALMSVRILAGGTFAWLAQRRAVALLDGLDADPPARLGRDEASPLGPAAGAPAAT